MKKHLLALAAVPLCCLACIETDPTLGGSLVPAVETYTFHTVEIPLEGISIKMADKLSGYSDARITVGAIQEETYGMTTRSSAFPLIPMVPYDESFEIGENPVFKRFHFAAVRDTLSFVDKSQESILQNFRVYELESALDPTEDSDCNKDVKHKDVLITKGLPVYKGTDSLSFDFSEEFGKKYLTITKSDLKDIKTFLAKFPGIYMESDKPESDGGRINMFDVQLDYDANYKSVTGRPAAPCAASRCTSRWTPRATPSSWRRWTRCGSSRRGAGCATATGAVTTSWSTTSTRSIPTPSWAAR